MNKRKITCVLIIIGLTILITSILMMSLLKNNVIQEDKKIIWNEFYGELISVEYEKFSTNQYHEYVYNIDDSKSNSSFKISLPSKSKLNYFDTNVIEYSIDKVNINVSKTMVISEEKEYENIKEKYSSKYDKLHIRTTTCNKKVFAMLIEFSKKSTDNTKKYFGEEIRIYVKGNKKYEYAIITFNSSEKRIDEDVISKVLNSIKIVDRQRSFCQKDKCEANLNTIHNSLNYKFKIKFDEKKYVLINNQVLSTYNAQFITEEYNKVSSNEDGINKLTTINLKIGYNITQYFERLENKEKVKINGKNIIKSIKIENIEDSTKYKGTYIYQLDDKVSVILDIDSRLNNIEDVAKDFLKFEIK